MKSFAHQECIKRGLLSEDECPSSLLGPNYQTVLNFWHFLDKLEEDDFMRIGTDYTKLQQSSAASKFDELVNYVYTINPHENSIWNRVVDSVRCRFNNNYDYGYSYAAAWATHELIAMHKLIENNQPLIVVPLFELAH